MPYHLKRKGDDYFVVDDSGKKYSSHGLDKATARKQMTALNIAHARKEGYNIPPRDPSPTCKRRGTLKGNIGELHPELKAMFADKAENAFIEKLYSKFKALEKAPPKKMEVETKEIAEVKPKKKEFEVESKEIAEVKPSELRQMEMRQVKSKIKEMEEVAEDPRRLRRKIKLIRPVEEVESREAEPPTPVKRKRKIVAVAEPHEEAERVAARSIGEEIVAGVRPFNTLKQKERQDVYQQFLKEGITGDDVPKEYRKGYKTWIGKEKRKGRL